jgi:hypothetical protein
MTNGLAQNFRVAPYQDAPTPPRPSPSTPPAADDDLTALGRYERACRRALQPDGGEAALEDLALVTRNPDYRADAQTDPYLRPLYDNLDSERRFKCAQRFKDLVGDPVSSDFLALDAFKGHRASLRALGLNTAGALKARTDSPPGGGGSTNQVRSLADTVGANVELIDRWRDLAELALLLDRDLRPTSPEPHDDPVKVLTVLSKAGIHTRAQLAARTEADAGKLRSSLLELSANLAVVIPSAARLTALGAA